MNKKFIATIFICLTAGVLLGWIIFDPESNQSQTLEERQEYIDFLKSNPDEKIQDLNDLISVVGWEEYMEIFKTARSFVGDHSADDMVFDLIFQWKKLMENGQGMSLVHLLKICGKNTPNFLARQDLASSMNQNGETLLIVSE